MIKFKTRSIGEKMIKSMQANGVQGMKAFTSRPVKNTAGQWQAVFKGGTLKLNK